MEIQHRGAKIIASSQGYSIATFGYNDDKPGVLSDVSGSFARAGINIESIADERHSFSIAFVPSGNMSMFSGQLSKYRWSIENQFARISVIGEGMRNQIGLLSRITNAFARDNISVEMVSQALSQLNITIFVPGEYERRVVKSLYYDLFRSGNSH